MKEYKAPEAEIIQYLPEDVFLSGEGNEPTSATDADGYEPPIFQPQVILKKDVISMKKYIKPEFEAIMYKAADVLLESGEDNNSTPIDDIIVTTNPQQFLEGI